ncbi:MAG: hypothetical protein GW783_10175 [Deltaproteobacteria bacterium]|nr:hypothetical protein [Deltaproteobacteria bacterium]NCP96608.1 hypothetical protein [Deltaproteobacteria bacterium]NCS74479.1 hypothetical protein [Deltaproteobacteria bacterium]OIP67403.1 MAG: hypothetical protein AUK30_00785 [Nitrospirae bacterium CG2_30_70_394]HBB40745.1 hypothetical protein [Pseudomonadota bacterium]
MLFPTPPTSPLDLLLRQLTEEQRRMVVAFARFLIHDNERRAGEATAGGEVAAAPPQVANVAPRPEGELPVHTLKRMKRGYPMLSGDKLLGRAAELMMRHHVAGHDRQEVVEQIEALFAAEYEQWCKGPE